MCGVGGGRVKVIHKNIFTIIKQKKKQLGKGVELKKTEKEVMWKESRGEREKGCTVFIKSISPHPRMFCAFIAVIHQSWSVQIGFCCLFVCLFKVFSGPWKSFGIHPLTCTFQ